MFPKQMVWPGKGIQCVSDGLAGSQFRGPFQFLPKKFHNENCADVGWSGKNGRWFKLIIARGHMYFIRISVIFQRVMSVLNSLSIQKQNYPVGGRGGGVGGYEEGIKQGNWVLSLAYNVALKLPFFPSFISFASSPSIATDETNSQNCIISSVIFIILSKHFQPQTMLTLVPGSSCFQVIFGSFRIWWNVYSSRLNNNLQMTITIVIHQMFLTGMSCYFLFAY